MRMRNRRITEARNRNFGRRRINESSYNIVDSVVSDSLSGVLNAWERGDYANEIFQDALNIYNKQKFPEYTEEDLQEFAYNYAILTIVKIDSTLRDLLHDIIDNGSLNTQQRIEEMDF